MTMCKDKIMTRFLNKKIREKLLISYILIALIPLLLFGILGMTTYGNKSKSDVEDYSLQMIEQIRYSIDVYIRGIEKVSIYIMSRIGEECAEKSQQQNINDISKMLYYICKSQPEISGILFVTEKDVCIGSGMKRISRDSLLEEEWYKRAVDSPDSLCLISDIVGRNIQTGREDSAEEIFSLAKAVVNEKNGEIMGVLLMDIRHDIISESIEKVKIGEKGFALILDANDQVVYSPINKISYRISPQWLQSEWVPFEKPIRGEKYQIRYLTCESTGWKVVGVFSVDEIMSGTNKLTLMLALILLGSLIVILFLALLISQTITKPIVELEKLMEEAERGNLQVRFEGGYQDEISQLGIAFNHMLERIDKLVKMVYTEQKNKRLAQIKALQEQIKPHFLYNTLDTINWMAREYKANDIVLLVDALTNMFRIGLSKGNDYIPLQQEFDYVKNYLYIQKTRYGTKLNVELELDEKIADYKVPKLILQPLVENAIYHGIKTKRGDGHLLIKANLYRKEEQIILMVRDDGAGMPEEKVKQLNERLNETSRLKENESFGLVYIRERLYIRYGRDFFVKVESTEGMGTKTSICIKFNEKESL